MPTSRLINAHVKDIDYSGYRLINGAWVKGSPTVKFEQEGFQFRNDDGSEITATDVGAQDAGITEAVLTPKRLRILVNTSTLDPPTAQFRLEVKLSTDDESQWRVVE